jgi:hypothetical protein
MLVLPVAPVLLDEAPPVLLDQADYLAHFHLGRPHKTVPLKPARHFPDKLDVTSDFSQPIGHRVLGMSGVPGGHEESRHCSREVHCQLRMSRFRMRRQFALPVCVAHAVSQSSQPFNYSLATAKDPPEYSGRLLVRMRK